MRCTPAPIISPLRVCSLFSGIGGFELGLQAAGHSTVMMCESDPHAQAVLRHRFPHVELQTDVTEMVDLPDCDLVTAGWPCQDLSLAGGMAGLNGLRSNLIREVFRLIAATKHRPRYIILENVAFALDLHGGRAVEFVTGQLAELGYNWAYRVLNTQAFGLPQRRRRLFILASLAGDPGSILLDGIAAGPLPIPELPNLFGFYWTEGNRGLGWSLEAVPPLKGGSGVGIPSPPAVWDRSTSRFVSPGIDDAERLQGFPVDWTLEASSLPRGDRRRWILVGNAVSVPIAEWLGRRLGAPENSDRPVTVSVNHSKGRMPRAADGGHNLATRSFNVLREGPTISAEIQLGDFGLRSPKALSQRAISGFTRRFEKASLRKDPDFLADLRAWSSKASPNV